MDNVEVLAGLEAAVRIETEIFKDTARAQQLSARVVTLRNALHSSGNGSFYSSSTGQYAIYKDGAGTQGKSNMKTWYPDIMAQFWPTVFNQGSNAKAYVNAVNALKAQLPPQTLEKGDCITLKKITGEANAPVIAYALKKANAVGADALTKCMYNNMKPTYAWPVTAADAGWLLRR